MNQHNEHILLKYAQTRQIERSLDAQHWHAARFRPQPGLALAASLGLVGVITAALVVVMAFAS